ncbi:MAG: efflux RND transporter permease subunit, partial [Bacteroidales bacterium]|nr:efflux RND transporter permease subunit [Bacteroidales bacterium]
MRKVIAAFIKYPFYSNIIIVILVVAGTFSTMNMKQSFFPETKSRDIVVTVFYPGASPKEMEEGITTRVEEAVRSIVGLKEINSTSSENFSRVTITTTGEYDLDATLQEVKNAVDGISSFPSAAERPIVYKQRNMTGALFMGLAGEGVDMMTLKKYATDIEDDLRTSGIITQVSISGIPNIEISVEISEMNLQRYGLTMDEVSRAIALNNADISAGVIKSSEEEILIRSRHRSVDPNKIGNIVLRANPDGSLVRIKDVANVKLKFEDVPNYTLMNDMQSVFFQVNKLNEEDLKDITKFCMDYAEKFNQENDRVKLYVTFNFLKLLKARLMLLIKNGLIGLVLVLATLGLFLNLRLSFWVAWGIPASFLGMFMVASLMGITINMITLFAMILVIGILVDDGIVIAENIYAHFEQGKSPQRAALDGTMEVLPAVTTSILTTVIAFSPLLLVKEGGFEFMFEMAIVVIFSLLMSLLEAFFVLPAHVGKASILSKVKSRDMKRKSFRQKMDGYIDVARNKVYAWLLKRILRWRWVYVFVPVGLLIITIGLVGGGVIKVTPFPAIPFEFFQVNMAFTPGSGEQKTMEYLKRVEDSIWVLNDELMAEQIKMDDEDTIPFITYSFVGVGNAFQGVEIGSHAGNIFVQLRDLENTGLSSFDIVARLQKKVGPIPETEKFTIGGGNRFGKAVSLSLLGKDIDELK